MMWQTLFCKLVIGYVLWNDMKSSPADTALYAAFVLLGTIILAYVFGAGWDDLNKMKFKK
jgi:hypothetical protein